MFGSDPLDPAFTTPINMPKPKPQGGMFGGGEGKFGIGQALIAALNGYLAGTGNPVGMQNMQMMQHMAEERRRHQQDLEDYARKRTDDRSDFTFEQDYKAAHQAPDDFTQMMRAAGVDPDSEQGKALYLQAVQNKANPFTKMTVQNPDGSETMQFMRPPAPPRIFQTLPPGAVPINEGGPTPQASGGFPY